MSENKNVVESHGCIVCARLFSVLAVYSPAGRLVDCTVTRPGGRIVPDSRQPLVACDNHTASEIDAAYKKWQSRNSNDVDDEQEEK
jgi:hypothetical protein